MRSARFFVHVLSSLRPILRLVAMLLLGLAAAPGAAAQAGPGAIEGVARTAESGAPLAFSLVRLLRVEQPAATPQQVLTDAAGRFRFASVPAGEYRLQVERIGYQRMLSPVVRVRSGETLRHEIRSAVAPIRLTGISSGPTRCLSAGQLAEEPAVAALWNEARKGMETRRAFELQYRFVRTMRQQVTMKPRIGKTNREQREDTIVSEPDSVLARALRRQEQHRTEGYLKQGRTTFTLRLPNEADLLDEAFLRDHCLEASVDEEEGALALRFRPVRPPRDRVDIQGVVWVDGSSYLVRRLEIEYVEGKRSLGEVSVDYADVPVGGSTLRLPTRGRASGRPGGPIGVVFARVGSDITFAYRDFQQVRSR